MQESNQQLKQEQNVPKFKSKFSILNAIKEQEINTKLAQVQSPISQYLNALRNKPISELSKKSLKSIDQNNIKNKQNNKIFSNTIKNEINESPSMKPGIYLIRKKVDLNKDIDKIALFNNKKELVQSKSNVIQEPGLFQLACKKKKKYYK